MQKKFTVNNYMKTYKEYDKKKTQINEGLISKQGGVDIRKKISDWCHEQKIERFTINDDLTIEASDVKIIRYTGAELPDYIQFGACGAFALLGCDNLKSLRGCPTSCDFEFKLLKCPKIETLEHSPSKCASLRLDHCDSLTSLKGAPKLDWSRDLIYVEGCLEIRNCSSLKNLVGGPNHCRSLTIEACPGLTSLKGAPKIIEKNATVSAPLVKKILGLSDKASLQLTHL